ncbi:hypothetical protein [Clostridium estertheticum]|nr:hypothetical protein [Clostridium estertheticum]MCB2357052.1 hypothetical protein [Clostridium estertheticum]WAG40365.1 hypothetical protein LL065_19165 [Clostridium estertheticum]
MNLINKLGRLPKWRELRPPNTTFTQKVYYKYWGSIENCVTAIGLDYTHLKNSSIDLRVNSRLDSIIEFKSLYNRMPAISEFGAKNALPSYHWVCNNFETYENLIIHLENLIDTNSNI